MKSFLDQNDALPKYNMKSDAAAFDYWAAQKFLDAREVSPGGHAKENIDADICQLGE